MLKFFTKKNRVELKNILVLGDSHSRAFSFNSNFFPIFLGPGKKVNFVNNRNFNFTKKKIKKVIASFGFKNQKKVILYLGEPDTRFYLGKGWYPWDSIEVKTKKDSNIALDKSFNRYVKLVLLLKKLKLEVLIMNVTPSKRISQNEIVDSFNQKLKVYCDDNGVDFIDINSKIYSYDDNIIKDEYYLDHVHLNTSIQTLVEDFLLTRGHIKESKYSKSELSNEELQGKYNFDSRFGCYTLQS